MAGFDFGKLFNGQMIQPNTADRLAGIGTALGALDQGKVADLSGFRQGIRDRISSDELRQQISDPALLEQFTPEQRQMLATLPPQAAQQIIAETVFKAPDPAVAFRQQLQESGVLNRFTPEQQAMLMTLDPASAQQVIADTLFAGPADPVKGVEVGGNLVNPIDGSIIYEGQPQQGHRVLSAEEAAAMGLPQGAYQQAPDGKITSIGGGGQTINVGTGSGDARLPEGFVSIDAKTGLAVMLDPSSPTGVKQVPIPGGAADVARQAAAAEAAQQAEKTSQIEGAQEDSRAINTSVLTTAIDNIYNADTDRILRGQAGEAVSGIGGTANREIYKNLNTLKGMASFSTLQAMREASPTGGALGSISAPELALLEAQKGALDPASPNFEKQLADFERAMLETIHGPQAGAQIWAQSQVRRFGGAQVPSQPSNARRLTFNPQTGGFD